MISGVLKLLLILETISFCVANDYELKVKYDKKIVVGGSVNFYAELLNNGKLVEEDYAWSWHDSVYPSHEGEVGITQLIY